MPLKKKDTKNIVSIRILKMFVSRTCLLRFVNHMSTNVIAATGCDKGFHWLYRASFKHKNYRVISHHCIWFVWVLHIQNKKTAGKLQGWHPAVVGRDWDKEALDFLRKKRWQIDHWRTSFHHFIQSNMFSKCENFLQFAFFWEGGGGTWQLLPFGGRKFNIIQSWLEIRYWLDQWPKNWRIWMLSCWVRTL